MAGVILALSTSEVAYQDALSLFAQDVSPSDRWQVRLVAGPTSKAGLKTIALAGYERTRPGDVSGPEDLIIVQPVDRIITGSVARTSLFDHRINRGHKSDFIGARNEFSAGTLQTVALFAPAELEPNLPRTAFIILAPAKTAIAAADIPAKASGKAKSTKTAKAGAAKPGAEKAPFEPPPVVTASAYAATDDVETATAPFEAVMGTPKEKIDANILIPDVGANHAWVNKPLPASAHSESELKCLATAIYFEARGEPENGQVAVAQVVLNRYKNPAYPNTICGVVYQNKNMRHRCQFSFACDGIRDRITDLHSWETAQAIAKKVVAEPKATFLAEVGESTHYHATYVRPRWARHMKKMEKIGRHVFYRTYGGGWS